MSLFIFYLRRVTLSVCTSGFVAVMSAGTSFFDSFTTDCFIWVIYFFAYLIETCRLAICS